MGLKHSSSKKESNGVLCESIAARFEKNAASTTKSRACELERSFKVSSPVDTTTAMSYAELSRRKAASLSRTRKDGSMTSQSKEREGSVKRQLKQAALMKYLLKDSCRGENQIKTSSLPTSPEYKR